MQYFVETLGQAVDDAMSDEGQDDEEDDLNDIKRAHALIKEINRVSKPGRRVYAKIKELPRVYAGLGISILSTPRGVMSDAEARAANVGGEVLCRVF